MSLWHYLKRLYSLDTLDTRFVTSSNAPAKVAAQEHAVEGRSTPQSDGNEKPQGRGGRAGKVQPSKFKTPEFYFYFFIIAWAVLLIFYVPYKVSQKSNPEYEKFSKLLSPGWIPGRLVDNSDAQYSSFRDGIPYVTVLLIAHVLLRKGFEAVISLTTRSPKTTESSQGEARQKARILFDITFGVLFLLILHGSSSFKIFILLYTNYAFAKNLPRQYIPAVTWIFNVGLLFANEFLRGFPYASMAQSFMLFSSAADEAPAWAKWLDGHSGMIPRWEILFKFTILRLISFNMDYYWSLGNQSGSSAIEKKPPHLLTERDRITTPYPPSTYNLPNYLSYTLYAPLYLAGPILTYNDFRTQQAHQPPSIQPQRTALYVLRFLLVLLTMELVLHFIYAVAISKASPHWSAYTPLQLSLLGFFNLHIIWLKLLIPWRFFRSWALLDGIDPPENMVRCMSNNYSALAFWRGWHRSFNRWILRYIYIPLGGSGASPSRNTTTSGGDSGSVTARKSRTSDDLPPPSGAALLPNGHDLTSRARRPRNKLLTSLRSLANMLLVFTFVALWHDITPKLLYWSWLIVLFLTPELLLSSLFPPSKFVNYPNAYRWLCGVGAVGNVLMMMAANLVGFALGVDGFIKMCEGIVRQSVWGWVVVGISCGVLFTGVEVMFEIREAEKRVGVWLNC